ncbi:hypothetical protein [Horticoccus sp. 23ND18S-11]|uniref:hypothetical protein n=1 Tax=Horticoccus sp. 23ND18S-11 TaxID=3391832 RepID=UPI0039C9F1B0
MGEHRRHRAPDVAGAASRLHALAGRRRGFALLSCLLTAVAVAAPRDVDPTEVMPQRGDHAALSWREGPPYFTTARYSADRRFLRLETGYFAAEFDTERIAFTGFAASAAPRDEATATRAAIAAEPLPAAPLTLTVRVGDTVYRCVGRKPLALDTHGLPAMPLEFPVRVIESGRFYQKFALHDLEFQSADGRTLAATGRLEISAWPDRLALTLVIRPEQRLDRGSAFLRLQSAGGRDASLAETPVAWEAGRDHRSTLTLNADGSARSPAAPEGVVVRAASLAERDRTSVEWNAEEACHVVRFDSAPWPEVTEGIYPEAKLDAWETRDLTLENQTAIAQRVVLAFDHQPARAITGFVPMLLDPHGRPTGIPIQISKNWHQIAEGTELPYAGPWMHGRTSVTLPANARVTLRHGTTFARWGGVPTASLAQLSLVGWGHNGFWDQFALGSFGESLCFQPGRTMRRALLTDFRPLLQRGFAQGERWAWASNLGGGDTMVRIDPRGRYVPFKRNVTRYTSHGPNLAQLDYEERSADDAVRSRITVFLPRTDDCLRVYLRVRYDVLRRVEFSRLALFQLGADYYNDSNAPLLAWGHADGLWAEHRPALDAGARALPSWQARGSDPWVSLHGEPRADAERSGQGMRSAIVRSWQAVLGGRAVPAPTFTAVGSRGAKSHLGVEIAPPPDVTALLPGDSVDLLVELLALPLSADRYYGPDRDFAAALAAGANTWKMAQREAALNRPELITADDSTPRPWPLAVAAGSNRETAFTLRGGLGWIPVRLTGLDRPDAVELFRVTTAGRERVVQGDPARAYWQSDYDVESGRWSMTCNLPATAQPASYVAVARARAIPPPVPRSPREVPAGR